jgi:hypothetical protein
MLVFLNNRKKKKNQNEVKPHLKITYHNTHLHSPYTHPYKHILEHFCWPLLVAEKKKKKDFKKENKVNKKKKTLIGH